MLKKTRLVSLTLAIALSMAMLPQAAMAKTINWDEEMAKQHPEQYDKTDVNPPAMTPDEHSSADYVDAQGHWFRNSGAMDVALQIGIMHGYDDTHFGPDDYITNAQVLTILYNYTVNQGWTSPDKWSSRNTTWRTDIPDYEYYTKPANWANSHNFLSFIEGDINAPITRGSLMRLVYFYAVFYDTVPVPNYIDDAYKIRDMYRDANNYSGETFYDDQGNSYVG